MDVQLDHIVIAARTLDDGASYIRETLGVDIPPGGQHEMMGTHNRVMSMANGVYLEVIAVNPDMTPPDQPRWFGLDDPRIQKSISHQPKLITWAVNTTNLDQLVNQSAVSLGAIKSAQRDNLKWKVAITEDGRMPGAGFMPLSIQWLINFHPSEKMAQLECEFKSLTLYHPRAKWLCHALSSIQAEQLVEVVEIAEGDIAYMALVVSCPAGEVIICSS